MAQKYILVLVALLAGCDEPRVGFINSPQYQVQIEGWHLSLYREDDLVQVVRTNMIWGARRETLRAYADHAVYAYFGCTLSRHTIVGDQVGITAEINC